MFNALVTLLLTAVLLPAFPADLQGARNTPVQKQLAAVRGEVVRIKPAGNRMLLITVRPARDYSEITVLARENDLVGAAAGHEGGEDLLGLLAGDPREEESITAAELSEGDVVSVIFDPLSQNRVLEIYIH